MLEGFASRGAKTRRSGVRRRAENLCVPTRRSGRSAWWHSGTAESGELDVFIGSDPQRQDGSAGQGAKRPAPLLSPSHRPRTTEPPPESRVTNGAAPRRIPFRLGGNRSAAQLSLSSRMIAVPAPAITERHRRESTMKNPARRHAPRAAAGPDRRPIAGIPFRDSPLLAGVPEMHHPRGCGAPASVPPDAQSSSPRREFRRCKNAALRVVRLPRAPRARCSGKRAAGP